MFLTASLSFFSTSLSCFFGEGNIQFFSYTVFTYFSSLSLFSNCQRNLSINLNSSVLEILPNLLLFFFFYLFPFLKPTGLKRLIKQLLYTVYSASKH